MKKSVALLVALALIIIPAYVAADVADKTKMPPKAVALAIEGVESVAQMEEILKLCQETDVKVTFIVQGNLSENLLIKAVKQGHEISNYKVLHDDWTKTKKDATILDIGEAARVLPASSLAEQANVMQGTAAGDWLAVSPEEIRQLMIESMQAGDIINFNMKTNTITALSVVITEMQQAGYKFVTISELLGKGKPLKLKKPSESAETQEKKRTVPFVEVDRITTNRPYIALTFDDAGSVSQVTNILDILRDNGAKATFFLNGEWADVNPELVRRTLSEGHEIANHSYSHPSFTVLGEEEMRNEILTTQKVLENLGDSKPVRMFRPPYGEYDKTVTTVLREMGYSALVMWDVDSRDWTGISAEKMVQSVSTSVTAGSIVLFHLHGPHTAEALSELIPLLKSRGYILTTVSTMQS